MLPNFLICLVLTLSIAPPTSQVLPPKNVERVISEYIERYNNDLSFTTNLL
jgi:hypothetical protein